MPAPAFTPGFRISPFDVAILTAGAALAAYLASIDRWLGITAAFIVAHFFLFCNIARISRRLEYVWAGVFLALAVCVAGVGWLTWPAALAIAGTMTCVVVGLEARKPSYHGVGWQRINPGLRTWWEESPDSPARWQ